MKGILIWPIKQILWLLYGYDFFISYAHADGTEYAESLRGALEAEPYKFSVHLDTRDFNLGEDLGFLTRTRVDGSRMLIVVARKHALTSSKWVRDEVDIFAKRGRNPAIVDVADAVAIEPVVANHLSEWIAQNPDTLRLLDPDPEVPHRQAPREVIDRIAGSFDGVRTRVLRERVIALALFVLLVISIVAVWQANEAILAEKQARSRAFAAAAYSYSDRDPTLSLRLAQRAAYFDELSGTGRRAILRAYNSGSWFYDNRVDEAIDGDLSIEGNFLGYILGDFAHIRDLATSAETTMPAMGSSVRLASNGNVATWSGFESKTTVTIRTIAGALIARHDFGRSVTAMDCGNDTIAMPAFTIGLEQDDSAAPRVNMHLIDISSGILTTHAMPHPVENLGFHGACARGGSSIAFIQTYPFALAIIDSDHVRIIGGVDTSGYNPANTSISPDGQQISVYLAGAVREQVDGILVVDFRDKDAVKTKILRVRRSPSFDSGGRILFLGDQRILVASTDGWLQIVDLETNARSTLTTRHRAADALAVSPKAGTFVVARRSGAATIYSREGEPIASLVGTPVSDSKNPAFRSLRFDSQGRRLLTASRDGIRTWHPRQKMLTSLRAPDEDWTKVPVHPFKKVPLVGQLAVRCRGTRDGYDIDDAGVASQCFAFAGQEDKLPTQFLKPDLLDLYAISNRAEHLIVWLGTKFARFFVLDPDWALNDALTSERIWEPEVDALDIYIQ